MPARSKSLEVSLAATSPDLKLTFPVHKQTSRGENFSTLELIFPSFSLTSPGKKVEKTAVQGAPALFIKASPSSSCNDPEKSGKAYIAISLDLDAPLPCFPVLSPSLHTLQTDLKASTDPDVDGWAELKSDVSPIVSWETPALPAVSPAHRFVFMVFEQPDGLTEERMRKEMGLQEEVGQRKRMRWNQSAFEAKFGLAKLVAGNWFVCGREDTMS